MKFEVTTNMGEKVHLKADGHSQDLYYSRFSRNQMNDKAMVPETSIIFYKANKSNPQAPTVVAIFNHYMAVQVVN